MGSLYRQKQQQHGYHPMLTMCVNGALIIFGFASWLNYVPIGWRYPFMRFWQPWDAKITAKGSLPNPENECQQSINCWRSRMFGNHGILRIFVHIIVILTALKGKMPYIKSKTHIPN
jgi:hypothetical protein